MNRQRSSRQQIRAEAAAWIARLQSADAQDPLLARGLQRWLDEDTRHREAFDRATQLWDMIAGADLVRASKAVPSRRIRWPRPLIPVLASLLLAALVVLGKPYLFPQRFETAIGEQRTVQLSDGSEITLNTSTAIEVRYGWRERDLRLLHGEALFRVAHDPERVFRVHHTGGYVDALGTVFLVYDEPSRSAVTLIEGSVAVSSELTAGGGKDRPIILKPGERLVTDRSRGAVIDRPSVASVTAWQRRQLLFDDVSLQDAVYEVNRYATQVRVLVDPDVARLRLSGVFSSHDPRDFASAIATLHGLSIEEKDKNIYLRRRAAPRNPG